MSAVFGVWDREMGVKLGKRKGLSLGTPSAVPVTSATITHLAENDDAVVVQESRHHCLRLFLGGESSGWGTPRAAARKDG